MLTKMMEYIHLSLTTILNERDNPTANQEYGEILEGLRNRLMRFLEEAGDPLFKKGRPPVPDSPRGMGDLF